MARPALGGVEREVEVEVALGRGPCRGQPAVAAGGLGGEPPGAQEQPRGELARLRAQLRVGRGAEVGEQRDRGVGIAVEQLPQRLLVELADRRGDLVEPAVAARELVTRERPAAALADDVARGGAGQRAPAAFPGGSESRFGFGAGSWRSISSSTISSGVRSHPSSSRSRPDRAATAASA